MYCFNNCVCYSVFLILLSETSSNRNWRPKNKELSQQIVASQIGKESREKKQFQGYTESYCRVIPLKERLIQNSRTKSEKARNEFLSERKIQIAWNGIISGRCKNLKEESAGVRKQYRCCGKATLSLVFPSCPPQPHCWFHSVSWPTFCELCCRQQGYRHDQEAGLKG